MAFETCVCCCCFCSSVCWMSAQYNPPLYNTQKNVFSATPICIAPPCSSTVLHPSPALICLVLNLPPNLHKCSFAKLHGILSSPLLSLGALAWKQTKSVHTSRSSAILTPLTPSNAITGNAKKNTFQFALWLWLRLSWVLFGANSAFNVLERGASA